MKLPDKFPPGCFFMESEGGDDFVKFPDGRWFKLSDSGELRLMTGTPIDKGFNSDEARFVRAATRAAARAARAAA